MDKPEFVVDMANIWKLSATELTDIVQKYDKYSDNLRKTCHKLAEEIGKLDSNNENLLNQL